jgi:hypothetical protein
MTHTLEGRPAHRPLERCVAAPSGNDAVLTSSVCVACVAGPRGEAATP